MTALAVFCLATVPFLVFRDLFVEHARDVEVWFGFEFRGMLARATAPLHWAIFLVGAWGFWFRQQWIVPWAAGYVFYVSLSHLVWSEVSDNGQGWSMGLAQAVVIAIPGVLLLRAHQSARRGPATD